MYMQNIINQAINNHQKIQIVYENDPSPRIIEPHTLGFSRKRNLLLSAFQTSGFSKSGEILAWKLFDLKYIKEILLLDNSFDIRWREGFNPHPSRKMFLNIIKQIDD